MKCRAKVSTMEKCREEFIIKLSLSRTVFCISNVRFLPPAVAVVNDDIVMFADLCVSRYLFATCIRKINSALPRARGSMCIWHSYLLCIIKDPLREDANKCMNTLCKPDHILWDLDWLKSSSYGRIRSRRNRDYRERL